MRPLFVFAPFLVFVGAGCDEQAPELRAFSESGDYTVRAVPDPWPQVKGPAKLNLTVFHGENPTPIHDAAIEVEVHMPDMGHGTDEPPTIVQRSEAGFEASWTYSMPGPWQLDIHIDGDHGSDTASLEIDVE